MMSDNLFDKIGVSVFKTELTRKITLNGETSALPVYKIKLSELFYNDKTIITEFLANNMTDLRQKMNYIDFESFKSLISCLILIHSKNSIEVFDKATIKNIWCKI